MSHISTAINSNIPFVIDVMPCEITLFKIRNTANCFNQQLYMQYVGNSPTATTEKSFEVFLLSNQFNVSVYYLS